MDLFDYIHGKISNGATLHLAHAAKDRQLSFKTHLLIYFFINKLKIFKLGH